jgi:hypothetical protein
MTNTIAEITGHVTLRGHRIEVSSEIGAAFVTDVCRHIEDLMPVEALRSKYGLADESAWIGLAENEPLQRAIAAAKERRIRSGEAARERAAHLFVAAPDVLGGIMSDTAASARHRIQAAHELRQVALPTAETNTSSADRITITLNFGTHKVTKDVELKPIKTIEHEDDLPVPRETGIIAIRRNEI